MKRIVILDGEQKSALAPIWVMNIKVRDVLCSQESSLLTGPSKYPQGVSGDITE